MIDTYNQSGTCSAVAGGVAWRVRAVRVNQTYRLSEIDELLSDVSAIAASDWVESQLTTAICPLGHYAYNRLYASLIWWVWRIRRAGVEPENFVLSFVIVL